MTTLGDPMTVDCPYCGQPAGEHCIDMDDGEFRTYFHRVRRIAALPRQIDRARRTVEAKRGVDRRRET